MADKAERLINIDILTCWFCKEIVDLVSFSIKQADLV